MMPQSLVGSRFAVCLRQSAPAVVVLLALLTACPSANAQGAVLTTLHVFSDEDGHDPTAALVQGSDGNFYGTASGGGANKDGAAFRLTPDGAFTKLHDFLAATDGQTPGSSLVEGSDGNFYGQARFGGASTGQPEFGAPSPGFGTVYRLTPDGKFTALHRYAPEDTDDGAFPTAGLILGGDGNFYGTTSDGGTTPSAGTAFRLSPAGSLTIFYDFSVDYQVESISRLVEAKDGNFYGTIARGGIHGYGGVFRLTPAGEFATLYSFGGFQSDGIYPETGLVQGKDGNFYGTTVRGGGPSDDGAVYRITPGGQLTYLHRFSDQDGITPSELIQDADGNLYGTTQTGGSSSGYGTAFNSEAGGDFLVIHRFFGRSDGSHPVAGLAQGRDGALYGSTTGGGSPTGGGTIFRLQLSAVPPGTVSLAVAGNGRLQSGVDKGVVVFHRTGDISLPLTVEYKFKGSAVAGEDFKPLSGTVTIPAGARQAKVKIAPLPNAANTSRRKLKITLAPTFDGSYKTGAPNAVKLNVIGGG